MNSNFLLNKEIKEWYEEDYEGDILCYFFKTTYRAETFRLVPEILILLHRRRDNAHEHGHHDGDHEIVCEIGLDQEPVHKEIIVGALECHDEKEEDDEEEKIKTCMDEEIDHEEVEQ